jgi:hypothetical protein
MSLSFQIGGRRAAHDRGRPAVSVAIFDGFVFEATD